MTLFGIIIYIVIVIVGIFLGIGIAAAISYLLTDDWSDGFAFAGLVIGIIAALWVNCQISDLAEEKAVLKETVTTYEVAGASMLSKQVSRSSGNVFIAWNDKEGNPHTTIFDDVKISDSEEWIMIRKEYTVENWWSDQFFNKETTWELRMPIDELHQAAK
jgi:hypothetical protein